MWLIFLTFTITLLVDAIYHYKKLDWLWAKLKQKLYYSLGVSECLLVRMLFPFGWLLVSSSLATSFQRRISTSTPTYPHPYFTKEMASGWFIHLKNQNTVLWGKFVSNRSINAESCCNPQPKFIVTPQRPMTPGQVVRARKKIYLRI